MSGPALLDRIDQAIRELHAIRAEVAALELPNIGPNGSGEATLARSAVERDFRGEIEFALRSEPLNLVRLCHVCHTTEHKARRNYAVNVDGTPADPDP